jgi:hypothetical protein
MHDTAAQLVERVLHDVPYRQWVLSLPRPLRVDGRLGAISFIQRFGSALNLNIHFHALLPDGVFAGDGAGSVAFVHCATSTR